MSATSIFYLVKRGFLFLLCFIVFTVIGTLSHEAGHIVVAKSLGFNTTLHYASMDYEKAELFDTLNRIYLENKEEIESSKDFEGKHFYETQLKK